MNEGREKQRQELRSRVVRAARLMRDVTAVMRTNEAWKVLDDALHDHDDFAMAALPADDVPASGETLPWGDVKDEWTTEIEAAFPTRSGSHAEYAQAMSMVGHRHSKGELVALVNWLLVERKRVKTLNISGDFNM